MTDKARLGELLAGVGTLLDDWGIIRTTVNVDGWRPVVARARELPGTDLSEHRRNKTDPAGPHAELIVAAVNALPGLLAENTTQARALAASTGREEALRAIIAGLERRVATCAALVTKLDEVHAHPAYENLWIFNQAHCGPYRGPTYTDELDAARLALKEATHADG